MQEQLLREVQQAIAEQESFNVHLLQRRHTSAKTRKLIVAHFKNAATDHINSAAPLVGVPGQVAWKSGAAGHLFFATVRRDEEPNER